MSVGPARVLVPGLAAVALGACALPSTDAAPRVPAPAVDPAARPGGTLRVGLERAQSLDPAFVQPADQAANVVARALCEPLLGVDPRTRELRPAVVRSWRVLDDGAQLQLTLSPDARFSDGARVGARDVLDSLRRVLDPATGSPDAPLLSHVAGYAEVQDGRVRAASVSGLQQLTATTVTIALDRHDASFLYALALPFTAPVEHARDLHGPTAQPVCAGPYRLAAPATPTSAVLVRSPAYAGTQPALARAGGGFADRIAVTGYPDRAAALAALRRGDVDVATAPNDALPGLAGLRALVAPTGVLTYVGLPERAPFDDPALRRRLSAALDRAGIVRSTYSGARLPASGFLPPTLPDDLDPHVAACATALPPGGRPPAGPRAAIRAPFYVDDEFRNRALVEAVEAAWRPLGADLATTPVSFDDLLARGASATGFDGAFRMAAVAPSPDPVDFLTALVGSHGLGTTNLTGFTDQSVDRQLDRQLGAALTPARFRAALAPLEQVLCTLLPVLPVAWGEAVFALGPHALPAAHDGLDRSGAVVDLRELAVR